MVIGIPFFYFPFNSDLICQKVQTDPEYTITFDLKIEFSNFQAAIVTQENTLHFNTYTISNSEYAQLKKQYSGEDYEDAQLTRINEHTVKITFRDKRYIGQIGKTRPEAKEYAEEQGYTCK